MNKLTLYRISSALTDFLLLFFAFYTFFCYVAVGGAEGSLVMPIIRLIIASLATLALYDLSFHLKYLINTEEWRKHREERRKTN